MLRLILYEEETKSLILYNQFHLKMFLKWISRQRCYSLYQKNIIVPLEMYQIGKNCSSMSLQWREAVVNKICCLFENEPALYKCGLDRRHSLLAERQGECTRGIECYDINLNEHSFATWDYEMKVFERMTSQWVEFKFTLFEWCTFTSLEEILSHTCSLSQENRAKKSLDPPLCYGGRERYKVYVCLLNL